MSIHQMMRHSLDHHQNKLLLLLFPLSPSQTTCLSNDPLPSSTGFPCCDPMRSCRGSSASNIVAAIAVATAIEASAISSLYTGKYSNTPPFTT